MEQFFVSLIPVELSQKEILKGKHLLKVKSNKNWYIVYVDSTITFINIYKIKKNVLPLQCCQYSSEPHRACYDCLSTTPKQSIERVHR